MISVVMQDVQQRNLNAKHCYATTAKTTETGTVATVGDDDYGGETTTCDGSSSLYIGLDRSCSQRKLLEVYCAIESTTAAIRDDDLRLLTRAASTLRVLSNDSRRLILYALFDKASLSTVLSSLSALLKLIFFSNKNAVYSRNDATVPEAAEKTLTRQLAYLSNFVLYHAFHESDGTFDARRFGVRYRHMRSWLFVAACVNAELLRVGRLNRCNLNLALNMQSLGKAYDDVGFHVFAENSIHQVRRAVDVVDIQTERTKGCDRSAVVPRQRCRRFATNGAAVNRYLGRLAPIGINAVSVSIDLF